MSKGEKPVARVRGSPGYHVLLLTGPSIMIFMLVLTVISGIPYLTHSFISGTISGYSLLYFGMVFLLASVALLALLGAIREWTPIEFYSFNFRRRGKSYSYEFILRVYANPSKRYIAVLFRDPVGFPPSVGASFVKKMIEPSLEFLLLLFHGRGVGIEWSRRFSKIDLLAFVMDSRISRRSIR